jgi:hypothetical protein
MSSQNKVIIQQTLNGVTINQGSVKVVSVGVQGPAGPQAVGGKGLPSEAPTSDDTLLIYDATTDAFVYTTVIDSGTFGD